MEVDCIFDLCKASCCLNTFCWGKYTDFSCYVTTKVLKIFWPDFPLLAMICLISSTKLKPIRVGTSTLKKYLLKTVSWKTDLVVGDHLLFSLAASDYYYFLSLIYNGHSWGETAFTGPLASYSSPTNFIKHYIPCTWNVLSDKCYYKFIH